MIGDLFTYVCFQDHGLDIHQLMGSSSYKETFRHDMIVWSEKIRSQDPSYFCKLATAEANRPVWIVCDARRESDMQFFRENHGAILLTVRIQASEKTRMERGWAFTKGIDDSTSECGLDDYQCHVNIINDTSKSETLSSQLGEIASRVKIL